MSTADRNWKQPNDFHSKAAKETKRDSLFRIFATFAALLCNFALAFSPRLVC